MAAKTTGPLIETAERRAVVLSLRKSGATFREIAAVVLKQFGSARLPAGWDERYAYKDCMRELERLNAETAASASEMRRLELERLDAMTLALWKQATSGNQGAIDRVLRLMERRAKLLGLDAPTKQEVTGPDGDSLTIRIEYADN